MDDIVFLKFIERVENLIISVEQVSFFPHGLVLDTVVNDRLERGVVLSFDDELVVVRAQLKDLRRGEVVENGAVLGDFGVLFVEVLVE